MRRYLAAGLTALCALVVSTGCTSTQGTQPTVIGPATGTSATGSGTAASAPDQPTVVTTTSVPPTAGPSTPTSRASSPTAPTAATGSKPTGATGQGTTGVPTDLVKITIPDAIKGQDRKNAEAAIKAYTGGQRLINQSMRDPESMTPTKWAVEIDKFLAPPVSTNVLNNITGFRADGVHQIGWASVVGTISSITGPNVLIKACEDLTTFDVVDNKGKSYVQSGSPTHILRYVRVGQWEDAWRVGKIDTPEPVKPC